MQKFIQVKSVFREYGLLGVILFSGMLIRLWGIGWGLPYLYHPDEVQVVNSYLHMVKSLSLNPHFFVYPGFSIYLNAFFYGLYYLVQRRLGHFQGLGDIAFPKLIVMGAGIIADPNIYYLGRALSLLFGLGTIYLSYRCAREINQKPWVGLLAAFTAFSNAAIVQSRLILPNIYVAFFVMLSILFSIRLYRSGKLRDYLLAGVAVGLTASAKYNGGLVIIVPIIAHFLRVGWVGWKNKALYFFFIAAGLSYILTNIYDLFDFQNFFKQFIYARNSYANGWPGSSDNPFLWYLSYLWRLEGPAAIAALAGIIYAVVKRRTEVLLLGIFPLAYLLFLSTFKHYNEHTLLHMLPAMHSTAAVFLGQLIENGLARFPRRRLPGLAAAGLLVLIALFIPFRQALLVAIQTNQVTSMETSRVWINQNLPEKAKIAIEAYSPFVDLNKFQVISFSKPHDISWYRERKVNYLVFSEGMYGRFFRAPKVYGVEIQSYERLFAQLELVKKFDEGNMEIRIYRMKE